MIDNLTFFQSLIAFLIILTPIVFVHELGHFIFARLFGVEVEKFSIGFGPVLFFFHDKNKTKWQIAAIPRNKKMPAINTTVNKKLNNGPPKTIKSL